MSTILLIDDSAAHRAEIRRVLIPTGMFDSVLEAGDGMRGLKLLLNESIDVVLCDLEMPSFDGEKLLHVKQASPASRNIPFVFLTGSADMDRKARLLEIGASDLISKPFHAPDLIARLRLQLRSKRLQDELRLKTESMARLSTTDSVTGLRTRRYATEVLAIEFLRTRRYHAPLSVLMADLDYFKKVNDVHGHLAGDAVLHGVSKLLLQQLRATDVAGRFGGEEFLVILPQNGVDGARVLAERWRMSVEQAVFPTSDGRPVQARISIGVAACKAEMRASDELIAAADEALYRAKDGGRNRVEAAD